MRLRTGISLALAVMVSPTGLAAPAMAATDLLPDMKMAPLYSPQVSTTANGRKKLRFGTIGFNVGDGPLEVRARNRDNGQLLNVAQWIYRSNGTSYSVAQPQAQVFYKRDGHDHWHVERFMVARLSALPGTAATARRIKKIGYCLVDSMRMPGQPPPNAAEFPFYGDCGWSQSRRITVGISVGWGDNYPPEFTFQAIDVTGLPQGQYRLCGTVNPQGTWTEKNNNVANNSYWLDLDLDAANNDLTVIGSGATPCS